MLFHNQNATFAEALHRIIKIEFELTHSSYEYHMRVTNICIMCYEYPGSTAIVSYEYLRGSILTGFIQHVVDPNLATIKTHAQLI